eukprot:2075978-Karenia_brevis.AAC.1
MGHSSTLALHPLSIFSPIVFGLPWDGFRNSFCQPVLKPIKGWNTNVGQVLKGGAHCCSKP